MDAHLFPGLGASLPATTALLQRLADEDGGPPWLAGLRQALDMAPSPDERQAQRLVHGLNLLCWRRWRRTRADIAFEHLGGHSLGFYAALVAAEVVDEDTSFALLEAAMDAAADLAPTGSVLKVITGTRPLAAASLAQEAGLEILCLNAPNQIVVHGLAVHFERLAALLAALGPCQVHALGSSVPFHSRLMRPASQAMRGLLQARGIAFARPRRILWSHVAARPLDSARDIADTVAAQLSLPVRWQETVLAMQRQGVRRFAEATPQGLLSRIGRWIDPSLCLIPCTF